MSDAVNRKWLFANYPKGLYKAEDFEWREEPVRPLRDGEVLVHNILLSLDPTNRAWGFEQDTYLPMMQRGDIMRGICLGVIEASRHPSYAEGTYVGGMTGWQEYAILEVDEDGRLPDASVFPRDPDIPLSTYLGLFGHIGMTAYYGLLHIGKPKAGETVVVSAAAGATGSLVGQIAKIKGCRVVGIAGGPEKCQRLVDEFGFDAVVDYKNEPVAKRLAEVCPDGVDVYYDNVSGDISNAVLALINLHARIVLAGQIAMYNDESMQSPRNIMNLIMQRGRMEGFVVLDFMADEAAAAQATMELAEWYKEGKIKFRTHIVDGLENATAAVNMLFDGSNQGKLIIKICDDPGGPI
jgi:NADPH-dependent curcumin reductase CurA